MLLENVKRSLTKRLSLELALDKLDAAMVDIIRKYAEKAGNTELGIKIVDPTTRESLKLYSSIRKFELSDDFIEELTKMEGIVYNVTTN